ncbi:protein-L-isoaspartate O-methyltransferase [Pelagicoccus sp. SDUM812003]|uniref:protein-L-isoaspartate O-methyltransferase family protein n=1 Tax=Pelagicoccus sp. SDUM812003 TaxID=3041267 RepID=UPI00280F0172|nr:protein-L-isoaspartate O-methyltransferase [Pelagicoccus sp. SDUM812003]MDQ8203289.1 protein-L-isoaspartate O-methyltransferase [Pelagicoccus sp. SDUM812003]
MTDTESALAQSVRERQQTLLHTTQRFFGKTPIPKAIRQAFLDTPRHRFVPRFYSSRRGSWIELSRSDLKDHLDELYADHPLSIFRDENGRTLSTISQPSLVLYMLDLLELEPGMSVFELGGGSGWNAAMLGRLVGSRGRVLSVEIIEELARSAQASIDAMNLPQVTIAAGDGSQALAEDAPFDRGVFTASAWDLPSCFFQQIAANGLLLLVVKIQPGCDLLALLQKSDHARFDSKLHMPCSFVSVTGSCVVPEYAPVPEAQFAELGAPHEVSWAQMKIPSEAISDFIAFARIAHDCQRSYLIDDPDLGFAEEFAGIERSRGGSLALFNEDRVLSYGEEEALIALRRAGKRWMKAGQPNLEDLKLSILRHDESPELSNDQWLVKRGQSQLLWSL